jgi:hypothetical protein
MATPEMLDKLIEYWKYAPLPDREKIKGFMEAAKMLGVVLTEEEAKAKLGL